MRQEAVKMPKCFISFYQNANLYFQNDFSLYHDLIAFSRHEIVVFIYTLRIALYHMIYHNFSNLFRLGIFNTYFVFVLGINTI